MKYTLLQTEPTVVLQAIDGKLESVLHLNNLSTIHWRAFWMSNYLVNSLFCNT